MDIHRKTAAQVFGIPYDEVDAGHRRRAKAINFGIVYGISAFGLSKEIETTPAEAQRYIDAYFANMPEVKAYMDATINFARQNGYVVTPFNRKITISAFRTITSAWHRSPNVRPSMRRYRAVPPTSSSWR